MPLRRRARNAAFTLLEILAVVAIFALLAGIALPNFSGMHARNLKHQANRIVGQLELARQRAIVTGVPHRLFIDIRGGAYHTEWFVSEKTAKADRDGAAAPDARAIGGFDLDLGTPLDLTAPRGDERSYLPVPGPDHSGSRGAQSTSSSTPSPSMSVVTGRMHCARPIDARPTSASARKAVPAR